MHVDLLLKNGNVVDVDAGVLRLADVAIAGDTIVHVGPGFSGQATRVVDCTGLVIAPGFIDAHVHGDAMLLADPFHEPAVRQGVTTYIIGQDGSSYAPGGREVVQYFRRYTAGFNGNPDIGWDWCGVADYLSRFQKRTAVNVAYLIPNGNLRLEVVGAEPRKATAAEIERMQALLAEGLDAGAVGLSSGLEYIPSRFADTAELCALASVVAERGLPFVSHIRSYAPGKVEQALDEMRTIHERTRVPVHISHFNVKTPVLEWIDRALDGGIDITYDTYPYTAGSTILAMVAIPPWAQTGGLEATLERLRDDATRSRIDQWMKEECPYSLADIKLTYIQSDAYRRYEGKMLTDAAREAGLDLCTFVCDLLLASDLAVGIVHFQTHRTEEDVLALMRHPAQMACSDGIFVGGHPHPRGWGAFAKFVGRYTRAGHWSIVEAVRHCSTRAAERFRLGKRGKVTAGYVADLVCFDPDTFIDLATYEAGRTPAAGVRHVLVNGTPVLLDGTRTTSLPGTVLSPS